MVQQLILAAAFFASAEIVLGDELSRIWTAPNTSVMSVKERAAAVNRTFTNGTPIAVVVASLGTNYTKSWSSAVVWLGPEPEPPKTVGLNYKFDGNVVLIETTAGLMDDPNTGTFRGASYLILISDREKEMSKRIWIGPVTNRQVSLPTNQLGQ